jgi:hypothetical protein
MGTTVPRLAAAEGNTLGMETASSNVTDSLLKRISGVFEHYDYRGSAGANQ